LAEQKAKAGDGFDTSAEAEEEAEDKKKVLAQKK
jgi:hypothetical protein